MLEAHTNDTLENEDICTDNNVELIIKGLDQVNVSSMPLSL